MALILQGLKWLDTINKLVQLCQHFESFLVLYDNVEAMVFLNITLHLHKNAKNQVLQLIQNFTKCFYSIELHQHVSVHRIGRDAFESFLLRTTACLVLTVSDSAVFPHSKHLQHPVTFFPLLFPSQHFHGRFVIHSIASAIPKSTESSLQRKFFRCQR